MTHFTKQELEVLSTAIGKAVAAAVLAFVAKREAAPRPRLQPRRISPVWKAILRELGTHEDGLTRTDLAHLARVRGAGPWWGRFVADNLVERVARGRYKLTQKGHRLVSRNDQRKQMRTVA